MKYNKKMILAGIAASIVLFSSEKQGHDSENDNVIPVFEEEMEEVLNDEYYIVGDIPLFYQSQMSYNIYDYLNEIKSLKIKINNSNDISWIEKCSNLNTLQIELESEIDDDKLHCLEQLSSLSYLEIKFINKTYYEPILKLVSLGNIKNLRIYFDRILFFDEDINFINDIQALGVLDYFSFYSKYSDSFSYVADTLKNEYKVSMHTIINELISKEKINNVNILKCYGNIEDLIEYCSLDDLNNNGIRLELEKGDYEKLQKMDIRLNEVYESLNINESASDYEKVMNILIYMVKHYEYNTNYELKNNSDSSFLKLNDEENEIICTNYAAIFKALTNKAGVESYVVYSKTHAFNIVKLEEKYYLIDPTWIDCFFDQLNEAAFGILNENFLLNVVYYLSRDKYYVDSGDYTSIEDIPIELEEPINVFIPSCNIVISMGLFWLFFVAFKEYEFRTENEIDSEYKLERKI